MLVLNTWSTTVPIRDELRGWKYESFGIGTIISRVGSLESFELFELIYKDYIRHSKTSDHFPSHK